MDVLFCSIYLLDDCSVIRGFSIFYIPTAMREHRVVFGRKNTLPRWNSDLVPFSRKLFKFAKDGSSI